MLTATLRIQHSILSMEIQFIHMFSSWLEVLTALSKVSVMAYKIGRGKKREKDTAWTHYSHSNTQWVKTRGRGRACDFPNHKRNKTLSSRFVSFSLPFRAGSSVQGARTGVSRRRCCTASNAMDNSRDGRKALDVATVVTADFLEGGLQWSCGNKDLISGWVSRK